MDKIVILMQEVVLQIMDFYHLSFQYKEAFVKVVLFHHTCSFYVLSY